MSIFTISMGIKIIRPNKAPVLIHGSRSSSHTSIHCTSILHHKSSTIKMAEIKEELWLLELHEYWMVLNCTCNAICSKFSQRISGALSLPTFTSSMHSNSQFLASSSLHVVFIGFCTKIGSISLGSGLSLSLALKAAHSHLVADQKPKQLKFKY